MEIHNDRHYRIIYATDASAYLEMPDAVAFPKDEEEIKTLVRYAVENHLNLIPRAAGTSLAGQVVGKGIVADISRYMNHILEINPEQRWVTGRTERILQPLRPVLCP